MSSAGALSDHDRFERIFAAHYRAVQRFARRRLASSADADDVVAETFTVAWRRLDDVPAQALPWLYGVAHRTLANQRRGDRRREQLRQRLAAAPDDRETWPALGDGVPSRTLIAALLELPEAERDALLLTAWEGLDRRAAAAVVGCSTPALAARLHRGRGRLRRFLDAEPGAVLPPNPPAPAEETP